MTLFLIQFEVTFAGKAPIVLKDEMLIPASSASEAKETFQEIVAANAALIVMQKTGPRVLVPVRKFNADVKIIGCAKVS
jgi:hypothetical protein